MTRKKIFSITALILIMGFFAANTCKAQDPADGWGDTDPGGTVPLPGAVYFLMAALGVGAKKIYDSRKNTDKQNEA